MADQKLDTLGGGADIAAALGRHLNAGGALPAGLSPPTAQAVSDLLKANAAFIAATKGGPGNPGSAGRGITSLSVNSAGRLIARFSDAPTVDVDLGLIPVPASLTAAQAVDAVLAAINTTNSPIRNAVTGLAGSTGGTGAPSTTGTPPALTKSNGGPVFAFDAAPYFVNATSGTWSSTTTGVQVDSTGKALITPGFVAGTRTVTVTFTKSGFSPVSISFPLTVEAEAATATITPGVPSIQSISAGMVPGEVAVNLDSGTASASNGATVYIAKGQLKRGTNTGTGQAAYDAASNWISAAAVAGEIVRVSVTYSSPGLASVTVYAQTTVQAVSAGGQVGVSVRQVSGDSWEAVAVSPSPHARTAPYPFLKSAVDATEEKKLAVAQPKITQTGGTGAGSTLTVADPLVVYDNVYGQLNMTRVWRQGSTIIANPGNTRTITADDVKFGLSVTFVSSNDLKPLEITVVAVTAAAFNVLDEPSVHRYMDTTAVENFEVTATQVKFTDLKDSSKVYTTTSGGGTTNRPVPANGLVQFKGDGMACPANLGPQQEFAIFMVAKVSPGFPDGYCLTGLTSGALQSEFSLRYKTSGKVEVVIKTTTGGNMPGVSFPASTSNLVDASAWCTHKLVHKANGAYYYVNGTLIWGSAHTTAETYNPAWDGIFGLPSSAGSTNAGVSGFLRRRVIMLSVNDQDLNRMEAEMNRVRDALIAGNA